MRQLMFSKLYELLIVSALSIIILAIAFYPAVFQGQIIYLEDPPGSDSLDLNIPRRYLAVQSLLKYGEFPLWEPRIGCGAPLLAESEAGVLHPALLFFFLNNLTLASNLTVLSAMLIAMLGSYAWCRCLRLEPFPSGIAALVYGLGVTFLGQTQALNIIQLIALLPVSLALIHLGSAKSSALFWLGLAAVWAMQLFASHFETFAICQICCWLFIIWYAFFDKEFRSVPRYRIILFASAALLLTVFLGAIQLLPTYELTQQSTRETEIPLEWFKHTSTPAELIRFIEPFYPLDEPDQEPVLEKFYLNNLYLGILAVLLCLLALASKRRKLAVSLWVMAILFYLIALGPDYGLYYLLWRYVPFMGSFRFPNRYVIPMVCILAVLAALGAQSLSECLTKRFSKRAVNAVLAAVILCVCFERIQISWQVQGYLPSTWHSLPSTAKVIADHQRIFSLYSYRTNLIAIHTNRLTKQQRQNIIWRHRGLLSPGMAPLWDIEAPDDYVFYGGGIVLASSADFQTAIHNLANVILQLEPSQINSIAPKYDEWLKLFGVTHLISPMPLPDSWPKSEFSCVSSVPIDEIPGEKVFVYELANPVKKIRLVPVLQENPPANALNLEEFAGKNDGDLVSLLGANTSASLYESNFSHPADIGQVAIDSETNNTLVIKTSCTQDAHLILSMTYDKNWQATVDGQPVKVQMTNLALQSLPVPAGSHRIELRYISPAFEMGWKISLAALIVFLIAVVCAIKYSNIPPAEGKS